jgi:hypothetical protein
MRIESLSLLIVNTIYPAGTHLAPEYNTLDQLAILLQAIESFFHPSNSGRWTPTICRFIQTLTFNFLERLRLEERPDCKTPQELRITQELRDKFVMLIRPLAFVAMFGKDSLSVMMIHGTLKNLSWISPELMFPGLLDRIYPALETLTEVSVP